jgi:hypothetical protein
MSARGESVLAIIFPVLAHIFAGTGKSVRVASEWAQLSTQTNQQWSLRQFAGAPSTGA